MKQTGHGVGLPPELSAKIASGGWIRTAHRGAPRVAAGNTLRAIETAVGYGVDLVEVDLHRTGDGRLVLWHDDEVASEAGPLVIAHESFGALKEAVLAGTGDELIDLERAMAVTKGRAGLMIDLKTEGLSADIVAVRQRADFGPAVVCGEYWDDLRTVRGLDPAIGTSLTLDDHWTEERGPQIEEIDTPAVTVAWSIVDSSFLDRLHRRGIAVLAWTVDDPELMRNLLRIGVDGLTSNRSDLYCEL